MPGDVGFVPDEDWEAAPFVPPAAKMELADLEAVAAPAVKEKATISQLFDEAFKSESPSMERIKGLLQKLSPKVAKAVEYVMVECAWRRRGVADVAEPRTPGAASRAAAPIQRLRAR